MTFTYVGTLATNLDKVRFTIGDRVSGSGPRPDSLNFTDEEIAGVITLEGGWGPAAAFIAEVLANEWSTAAGSVRMADYSEDYTARAEQWRKRAQELRRQHGGGRAVAQSAPTRVDGFSNDITAEET